MSPSSQDIGKWAKDISKYTWETYEANRVSETLGVDTHIPLCCSNFQTEKSKSGFTYLRLYENRLMETWWTIEARKLQVHVCNYINYSFNNPMFPFPVRSELSFFSLETLTSVLLLYIFLIAYNFLTADMDCLIQGKKKKNSTHKAVSPGELLWGFFFKCMFYQTPICHDRSWIQQYYQGTAMFTPCKCSKL